MSNTSTTTKTHHRSCNLCEAMCGLEIQYRDNEVLSIRGDKNDPFSKGYICPKAMGLKDIYEDPDRLRQPVRRTADGWETISWEAAFTEVCTRWQEIQEKYGKDSIGAYLGNPNVHNIGSILSIPTLLKTLGSKNIFTATSADQLPHHFASLMMFGHYMVIPVPDVDRTQFMLILGGNPLASNGSMMTAPGIGKRLAAIQGRGGKVIVVDPRRTETAEKADQHIFIRPNQDVFLLLAMVHTIFEESLVQTKHLSELLNGIDILEKAIADFSPERVENRVGSSAETIRKLAREFCASPSSVCYGRIGVSTQQFGGLCQWLINVLNILSGNMDREGGAMFTRPAFDYINRRGAGKFNRWQSRVKGLPEFKGELPVSTMIDEIMTPGPGQIKSMLTIAGNPVLSTPNGTRLEKGMEDLEFVVAIDIYINETTRHADIILPPATGLETSHYDLVFHALAVRNTSRYAPPLFPKAEGALYDWEIFKSLAQGLGAPAERIMAPEIAIDHSLRKGPYQQEGLSLDKLLENPSGIDLGPLQPCFPDRLFTEDKKIQIAPTEMIEDLERAKVFLKKETAPEFPFTLIGRRHLRSNNSWMHNSYRLVKGPERCTLLLNDQDAEALSFSHGEEVEVSSRVGSLNVKCEVTKDIMPGVVCLPHGWGHGRKGVRLSVATQYPGVSINDLTDDQLIDELTGNAAFNGVPVRVGKVNGKA